MGSGEERGHGLAAVLARCKVTLLCPVSLFFSLKDTTRPRKSHEKEGVEYHFVSKQAFEADLHHNKYVGSTARLASVRPGPSACVQRSP